jgi:hypothetical protein
MHASWTSVPIARIEDLRDAVYGAGLEATQISTGSLSGNLTFARRDDVLYSSGLINGQVALRGPLSSAQITVGVGLRMGGGTRHWLEETASGAVGERSPRAVQVDGSRWRLSFAPLVQPRDGKNVDEKCCGTTA